MLTEELHAVGVADGKLVGHEEAAHEKRNWVRLTYHCNDHCVFCLDSDTHDGTDRDREEVLQQILDGRRSGATRLILSGGEPTIHPNFVDFIKLGRRAGYAKIQTVTNGRLFSYDAFLKRCIDAGLGEITFSLHGPNAVVHDALVGTRGAFEQETAGLRHALADGRAIVNIDTVINRGNVKYLPEMLEKFYSWGVKEFDLLQVVPFGRAFTDGRETLFYDLSEARPYIVEALRFSEKPDVHIWFNRFPPEHLEGYEHLIQDPHKLNDEVRGRKEEFARLLDEGLDLDCRDPHRCQYCYLERLCDRLYDVRDAVLAGAYDKVRIDAAWEAVQEPVFGGDPASARRAKDDERRLPMLGDAVARETPSVAELVERARGAVLVVCAPDVATAVAVAGEHPSARRLELELDEYRGLDEALAGPLAARDVVRTVAAKVDQAERLLAMNAGFEVVVLLSRYTADWLLGLDAAPDRLALRQPTYSRLTESAERDVDVRDFFARFVVGVPVDGLPRCVTADARDAEVTADTAMMTPEGRLEIFRYTKRFIREHYRVKSLRCAACVHESSCAGMHINYVRARGFDAMQPVD